MTITMDPVVNISGWTLVFSLRVIGAAVLLQVSGAVTDAAGGVFTVSLTKAQTAALSRGTYDFDIWRTDSGSESRLVYGKAIVEDQAWQT